VWQAVVTGIVFCAVAAGVYWLLIVKEATTRRAAVRRALRTIAIMSG
jgi:hypothetical protein